VNIDQLPESLRARIAEQLARPPLEVVRECVRAYFGDADGIDEVRAHLQRLANSNTWSHRQDLRAIEAVLADPPADGVLAHLVGWDGNWVLDDPSDAGAIQFLNELADMLREVIAEVESQRP
jgi:hypothetical protein